MSKVKSILVRCPLSVVRCRSSVVSRHLISPTPSYTRDETKGFTLVELLVAISLVATIMAITFSTFYSVSNAWQRGLSMADNLNHGEYVMDQLVHGLRSAFFPSSRSNTSGTCYGFTLDDYGSGADSRDTLSWVKTGSSLLGVNDPFRQGVHRIQVSVEDDEDDRPAVAVRAWRPYGSPENFDPNQLDPFFVSQKVIGINCRVSTNRTDDGWEWQDTWEDDATNRLPGAVEITLYLDPLNEDEQAVEMKRLVEIPIAPLSWSK